MGVRIAMGSFSAGALALSAALAVASPGITPSSDVIDVVPAGAESGMPSVCARADGGFVLARSEGAPGAAQILVTRIDSEGVAEGADFVVSTYPDRNAADPDVACAADGRFAVVWTDRVPLAQENDGVLDDDVFARVFDAEGAALADGFRVNAFTTGNQQTPAVCALPGGKFAVIWQDRRHDEVDARVVSAAGPESEEAQVAEGPRAYMPPDVACSAGKFFVVWGDFPSAATNDEAVGRLFSGNGAAAGAAFFLNSYTTGDQGYPVACGSSDGFVVAWRDAPSRRAPGHIKARHISASGSFVGGGFEVSPVGRDRAQIACGAESSFVVTTHADSESGETLYAQAGDSGREPVGSESVVHHGATRLGQDAPPLAAAGEDDFLVVWPGAQSVQGRFMRIETGAPTTTLPAEPSVCGDAVGGAASGVTITDALAVLRSAVAGQPCEPCRCDTDGSGAITVQDALRVLAVSVGLPVELTCPACN